MARTKMVNGVAIALTAEEETARDAEEKEWVDGKVERDAIGEIHRLESTVTPRRIREMTTADGAKWVDDVEKLIAVERAKL
tara:strand:+ start:522 stop:764 length:243 start_codon:yes stop_codon:yes gene_type:complete